MKRRPSRDEILALCDKTPAREHAGPPGHRAGALDATADALIGNADDYRRGDVNFETFARRSRQLWDSVHRSDHEALVNAIDRRKKK